MAGLVQLASEPTNLSNIGALILRTGFGAHYATIIVRNPQNSIGNELGPYSKQLMALWLLAVEL